MTLADRLDALLTRPIYDCDLETIREAAKRLRALETGSGAMTDIVERLRNGITDGTGLRWAVTKQHLEAADEITRLRTERSELIEALNTIANGTHLSIVHAREVAHSVLSKMEQKA